MPSQIYNVTGIAMYPKLFENNRDMHESYHGAYGGAYTIDVLLEKAELDKVTKSGSKLKPRITDEGISIKFKRKHIHPVEALGGPPKVADKDNEPWDASIFVGNGSKVEVWFEVFDTMKGKGTRLEGVKVLELEEYEFVSDEEYETKNKLPF
jgi:hypothetical protein